MLSFPGKVLHSTISTRWVIMSFLVKTNQIIIFVRLGHLFYETISVRETSAYLRQQLGKQSAYS